MAGELKNRSRPDFVRLSFDQRLKPRLTSSEMADACEVCLYASWRKIIFQIPPHSVVVADVMDRIREQHKIETAIELLTFDDFYLDPNLTVEIFGEIGAFVKVQPLRPGFQLTRQCSCRLPRSHEETEIMENSGNCSTLATETTVMGQEEIQPRPSDLSDPKLAISATIQESVSKNSEVEPVTAEKPNATDERFDETTSSINTSAAGSWTTIETETSNVPEQNQTDLLNGSVAEKSHGDEVDSDEGTKMGLELDTTKIQANSDSVEDSAEADDSSNESQGNTIISTSVFSVSDQSRGTGSESEVTYDDKSVGGTHVIERASSSAETADEINEKSEDLSAIVQGNNGNDPAGSNKLDESNIAEASAKTELKRCASSMISTAAAEMPSKKRKTNSDGTGSEKDYDAFMADLRKYAESNLKSEALVLENESSTLEGSGDPRTSTPNSILLISIDALQGSDIRDSVTDRSTVANGCNDHSRERL